MEYGANLVEINSLVLTEAGDVVASDAKVELDDNALYKHHESNAWRSDGPADADQAAALGIGLGLSNYAKLDGAIGVIASGAGLGMGTMDAIRNAGGSAANFLDSGGGARAELVIKSYRLVTDDPNVRAMFINIFGGITRGDEVVLASWKRYTEATCGRCRSSNSLASSGSFLRRSPQSARVLRDRWRFCIVQNRRYAACRSRASGAPLQVGVPAAPARTAARDRWRARWSGRWCGCQVGAALVFGCSFVVIRLVVRGFRLVVRGYSVAACGGWDVTGRVATVAWR